MPDGSGLKILDEIPEMTDSIPAVIVLSASDIPDNLKNKVSEAIVKSRISETKIVEKILYLVDSHKKGGK